MHKAKLIINRTGDGKFIMYIDDDSIVNIKSSEFNKNGDSDASVIYYDNSDGYFNLEVNSILKSDIFVKASDLYMTQGETEYSGQVVFDGDNVSLSQGVNLDDTIIYAPNSDISLGQHVSVNGSVITKNVSLVNTAEITYSINEYSYLLNDISGEPTLKNNLINRKRY